jgi:hypothetical protein
VSQKATDLPEGIWPNQALANLIQTPTSRPNGLFPNNPQGGKKKDIYIVAGMRVINL